MVKLSNNDPVLEEPQMNKENNYILNGINIQIVKTDKLNILNNLKKNSIVAILDGGLESIDKKLVLSPGDIVGTETIAKLSEVFTIQNKITYLKI